MLTNYAGLRQRAYPPRVNCGHPLARGLIYSSFNSAADMRLPPRNYVDGSRGNASGCTLVANTFGDVRRSAVVSQKYNGTSDNVSHAFNLAPYKTISVCFWLWWDAYVDGTGKCALLYGSNVTNQTGFYISPEAGGGVFIASTFANNTFSRFTFPRPSAAAWHHFAFGFDLTIASSQFTGVSIDGVPQTTTFNTQTQGAGATFSNQTLYIMQNVTTPDFSAGRIQNISIYNRLLGLAEVDALYRDPWAIFVHDERPLYPLGPGGGGGGPAANYRWLLAA